MYLTIASVVLAFGAGLCKGLEHDAIGEAELICRWAARFLGLVSLIFLAISVSV